MPLYDDVLLRTLYYNIIALTRVLSGNFSRAPLQLTVRDYLAARSTSPPGKCEYVRRPLPDNFPLHIDVAFNYFLGFTTFTRGGMMFFFAPSYRAAAVLKPTRQYARPHAYTRVCRVYASGYRGRVSSSAARDRVRACVHINRARGSFEATPLSCRTRILARAQ